MSTSKIGGVQFRTLAGFAPDPVGDEAVEISRPGIEGHEYALVGKRAEASLVIARADVTSAGGGTTLINAVKALQGTLVTVTDDRAQSWTHVFVERARLRRMVEVKGAVGFLEAWPTFDLEFELMLRITE